MTNGLENIDDKTYVAFCDILGFSERTLTRFAETQEIYLTFGELLGEFTVPEVEMTMYSDAILVTSKSLAAILRAVQNIWFLAMQHDMMLRGGVTQGRYWQKRAGNNLMVISDALVRAVKLEKMVSVPAVVLADVIEIPDEAWGARHQIGHAAPLLYFRDRVIVNPFNAVWLRSARGRAERLMNEIPQHRDKYLWFLALHEAIWQKEDLVPPAVSRRLFDKGVLLKKEVPPVS
jgi:hypothetical protein